MSDDAKQLIDQRLAELPENIRTAIESADLGRMLRVIGQEHNLHIDQIGKLEDETMLVMLGFFEPEQFNTQLEQQLLIPAADAAAIAGEVTTNIFLPIRESLKRFMEEKRAQTPVLVTPPPMPAVQTSPSLPSIPQADKILTEPTVVRPGYKTDPYREPIE